MANVIQEFMIALGWQIDPASQARVVQQAQQTANQIQARQTVAQQRTAQQVATQHQNLIRQTGQMSQQHAEQVGAAIGRLISLPVIGAVRVVGTSVRSVQATLQGLTNSVAGIAAVYLSGRGIGHLVADMSALDSTAKRVGSSVSNIRALDLAFRQIGGTSQDAMSSIEGLSQAMRQNPGVRGYLQSMGVNATDTVRMVEQLQAVFQRDTMATAIQRGAQFGLNPEVVRLLRTGELTKAFRDATDLAAKFGVNQEAATFSGRRLAKEWANLGFSASLLRDAFFGGAFGGGGGLLGGINAWVQRDGNNLRVTFERLGNEVGGFIERNGMSFVRWLEDMTNKDSEARKDFEKWRDPFIAFGSNVSSALTDANKLWESFDRGSKEMTGQGGVVSAFEILAAVLTGKVAVGLLRVLGLYGAVAAAAGLAAGFLLNKYLTPDERDAVSKGGAGDQEHAGKPGDPTRAIMSTGGLSIFERLWGLLKGGFEKSTENLNEAAKALKEVGDKAGGGGGIGMGGAGGTAGGAGGGEISTGGASSPGSTAPATPADTRSFAEKILPKALGGKDAPDTPEDTRSFRERVLPKFLGGKDAPTADRGLSGSSVIGGRAARARGVSAGATAPNIKYGGPLRGHIATKEERVAFITEQARKRGIDPKVALGIAAGEGLNQFHGDADAQGNPTSFGDFQLHVPGIGKNTAGGLGQQFEKETGLSVKDPKNWKAMDEWALEWMAKNKTTSPWHGTPRWARGHTFAGATPVGKIENLKPTEVAEGAREKSAARGTAEGTKPSGDIPVGETNKPGAIWKSPITGAIYKNDEKGLPSTVSKGGDDVKRPIRDLVGKVGEAVKDAVVSPAAAAGFAERKIPEFSKVHLAPLSSSNDNSKNVEFNPIYNTTVNTTGGPKEAATAFQRAHEGLGGETMRALTTAVR